MIKPRRRKGREGNPPLPPKGGKKKMLFFLRALCAFAVHLILLASRTVEWSTINQYGSLNTIYAPEIPLNPP